MDIQCTEQLNMEAVRKTKIKQSNLDLIKSGKIEGSKFFAYERLLNKKGSTITEGRLKGGKMLYLGGQDFIGAKITTFKGGAKRLHMIEGTLN